MLEFMTIGPIVQMDGFLAAFIVSTQWKINTSSLLNQHFLEQRFALCPRIY